MASQAFIPLSSLPRQTEWQAGECRDTFFPPGQASWKLDTVPSYGGLSTGGLCGSKQMLEDISRSRPRSGLGPGQKPDPPLEIPRRRHKGLLPHKKWFEALLLSSESAHKIASRHDYTNVGGIFDVWISLGLCHDHIEDIFCALNSRQ